MAITYNNLYMDIRQKLHRAGIDAATLEARELVAFAAGKTRQELLRDGGLYVSQEVEQRAAALEDRLFALLAQDGQTLRFEPPMPPESVRRLADAMVRANEARSAVFAGQDGAWHYAMADPSGDLRGLVKRLNAALQGRGGGKPGFVQGSLAASRTDIEAFFTAESCSMPDPA